MSWMGKIDELSRGMMENGSLAFSSRWKFEDWAFWSVDGYGKSVPRIYSVMEGSDLGWALV